MPERLTTPFLARRAYRLRRLMDAARLLPVLGAAGVILPVLSAGHDPREALWFGRGLTYFLGLWLLLVLGAFGLGRRLAPALGGVEDSVDADAPVGGAAPPHAAADMATPSATPSPSPTATARPAATGAALVTPAAPGGQPAGPRDAV